MTMLATWQVRSGKIMPYNCWKIGKICQQHMERNTLNAGENTYFAEVSLGNTHSLPPFVLHMKNWNKKTLKNSSTVK